MKAYHTPGCSKYIKRAKNAIFVSTSNSYEHELAKFNTCWKLKKQGFDFITEAAENKTGLRRDVVCLNTGFIYEIETTKTRAERFKTDPMKEKIVIIKLWEGKYIKEYLHFRQGENENKQ